MIRLIVGLGNPGPQYAHTRHNAGFWLLDRYAAQSKVILSFEKRFHGECGNFVMNSQAELAAGEKVFLLKPATYMNRSGLAVASLLQFYKLNPEQVLIVHDELDLLPGQAKLKQGGGHAGHNGLKDIQAALGGPNFWRLRLGIGHPRTLNLQQGVADFVLHPPNKSDQISIEKTIDVALHTLPLLLVGKHVLAVQQLQRGLVD